MNSVRASGWPPSGTVNPTSLNPRLSEMQRRQHSNQSAEAVVHSLLAARKLRACATHSSASTNTKCGFCAVVLPPPASISCICSSASSSFIAIDRCGARYRSSPSSPARHTHQRTCVLAPARTKPASAQHRAAGRMQQGAAGRLARTIRRHAVWHIGY
jgi:hypothetical protein